MSHVIKENLLKDGIDHYCQLDTAVDNYTLLADDCSLVTTYEVVGIPCTIGNDTFTDMIDHIKSFKGNLANVGHDIQVTIEMDPERSITQTSKTLDPFIETMKAHQLDIDDMIQADKNLLSQRSIYEKILLSVRTTTEIMASADQNKQAKKRLQLGKEAQSIFEVEKGYINSHYAFCNQIENIFRTTILLTKLNIQETLQSLKYAIDHDTSSLNTQFITGDEEIALSPKPKKHSKGDFSHLYHPILAYQLHTYPTQYALDASILKISDLYIASVLADYPPHPVESFDRFLESVDRTMPFRCSFRIKMGHNNILSRLTGIRSAFASMLALFGGRNKTVKRAIDRFEKLNQIDEKVVQINMSFTTWAKSYSDVKKRRTMLCNAMSAWGNMQCLIEKGEAMQAYAETLPVFYTHKPISRPFIWRVQEAFSILPIFRPASIWEMGQVLAVTLDKKLFPIRSFSKEQEYWDDLIFAPPGSGKSFLISSMLVGQVFLSAQGYLPYQAVIDANPSSKAFIDFMKNVLPEQKRHLAQYLLFKNTKSFCINIFDTPLGCRMPLSYDRSVLIAFLSALLAEKYDVPEAIKSFTNDVVDELYAFYSDGENGHNTKKYAPHIDEEIDHILEKYANKFSNRSLETWWDIVDALTDMELYHEAHLAQRHAMPTLNDLSMAITDSKVIKPKYEHMIAPTETKEPFLSFVQRRISSVISSYPMFLGPSSVTIGDAQFIAVNLQHVIIKQPGQSFHNGLMYTAALQMVMNAFSKDVDSFASEISDDRYRQYHIKRMKQLNTSFKEIYIDEYHYTKEEDLLDSTSPVDKIILGNKRFGRKFNLRTVLASQRFKDFIESIREMSANVYILHPGSGSEKKALQKTFGYSNDIKLLLDKYGSETGKFLLKARTKYGEIFQMLELPASITRLWRFNSVNEDVALRERLIQRLGNQKAISLLTTLWPTGSAKEDYERLRLSSNNQSNGVHLSIIDQLVEKAMQYHSLHQ